MKNQNYLKYLLNLALAMGTVLYGFCSFNFSATFQEEDSSGWHTEQVSAAHLPVHPILLQSEPLEPVAALQELGQFALVLLLPFLAAFFFSLTANQKTFTVERYFRVFDSFRILPNAP